MAELARIEARLESLSQLGELVGALRSMAASRLREAQQALPGTRAFCRTVDRAIASLQPHEIEAETVETVSGLLLVITSENGFVGGFNTRIVDRAFDLRRTEDTLVMVGRRGQMLATERKEPTDKAFAMTARANGVTQLARQISARLADISQARIVYAEHSQGGGFEVLERQILPLVQEADEHPAFFRPLHHLPVPDLLSRLASEYLFAEIAHALMESLVSENAARLMAMDSATRNIDNTLEKLQREERAARQEQTTADMLDVIVGTEVVNHGNCVP